MGVPTINSSALTVIDYAEATTNWDGWGSNYNKWATDNEFELEGTNCVAVTPGATGDGGFGVNTITGTSFNATTNLIIIPVFVASPAFVASYGSTPAGVYIRVGSSTTWTNYVYDYYVGGSDIGWVGKGWKFIVLDCNITQDRQPGANAPTLTAVTRVGVGFNWTATANKSVICAIDVMRYGNQVEVTGVTSSSSAHAFTASTKTITRSSGDFSSDGFVAGDTIRVLGTVSNDGEYTLATVGTTTMTTSEDLVDESSVTSNIDGSVTLEDIYQKDGPTDDNWTGILSKNRDGDLELNYKLVVGDESGTARTFFLFRGDNLLLADQPLSSSTAKIGITSAEDTGANTIVAMGQSSGTGDNRVGFGGGTIRQVQDLFSAAGKIDLNAAIDTCEVFGMSFTLITAGVDIAADTSHLVTTCTFDDCGQVDLGSAECRGLVFANFSGSADAALLYNANLDLEDARFLACTRGVEHEAEGSFGYQDWLFAGNTYDIVNSNASTTTDSYSETNQDSNQQLYSGATTATGQSITGDGKLLTALWFYLRKVNSPTGNVVAKLYAHSGTFGTSSVPTGTALATSKTVAASSLGTSYGLVKFELDDSQFYTLVNSTYYVVVVEYSSGDSTNRVEVGYDAAAGAGHGGNKSSYSGSWSADANDDLCFYVRTEGELTIGANGTSNPAESKVLNAGSPEGTTNINNTKTLTVTAKVGTSAVAGAKVRVEKTNGELILEGTTNASGVVTTSTYNYPGSPVAVNVIVRLYPDIENYDATDTITSDGLNHSAACSRDEEA